MPYDMTNSYAPNMNQQQLMPSEQIKDDGSTVAEAGSTPPNKTVHDIEPEKKHEDGDTQMGESSGEEDGNQRRSKEKYIKVLKEASEAREEYSSKLKKLIGEVNRHRSKQFSKLDQALEVLAPPNLKEKAISNSLKQDRRLPLRRRLRPVITGINPKQQLQEITKNLGEDAVMLLVSIGDMFINDLSSTEITAKYNIFTLNLVRNIRQVILNSFKRGVRRKREQPQTRKRRRTTLKNQLPRNQPLRSRKKGRSRLPFPRTMKAINRWMCAAALLSSLWPIAKGTGRDNMKISAPGNGPPKMPDYMSPNVRYPLPKLIDSVIFEPYPKVKLSRSSYKVIGFINFDIYHNTFHKMRKYIARFKSDLYNVKVAGPLYNVGLIGRERDTRGPMATFIKKPCIGQECFMTKTNEVIKIRNW